MNQIAATPSPELVQVKQLKVHFPVGKGLFSTSRRVVHAVDGLSFAIHKGETLALVGESGCGKSTVGKCLVGLLKPTGGEVIFDGQRIDNLPESQLRPMRHRMGLVFQDPFSSMNPRMRVREIVAEPIRNFRLARSESEIDQQVAELFKTVRLPVDAMRRWPHEFSGGQRQRICIARALAGRPDLLVCDEAVSALDVSVKAQIVNLLRDLQVELGLAMLFISHDLAIVEQMTHRVAVMYLGRIVELAPRRRIFASPVHPYTESLLSAVPVPEPGRKRNRIILTGDVPSPITPPPGCHFHTRCRYAEVRCREEVPLLRPLGPGHWSACHFNERFADAHAVGPSSEAASAPATFS